MPITLSEVPFNVKNFFVKLFWLYKGRFRGALKLSYLTFFCVSNPPPKKEEGDRTIELSSRLSLSVSRFLSKTIPPSVQ
jgi:hypothetical protein